MIPVRLMIKGFLSYREPVVLDFTEIHLACISGENGAGKSALLDAITWALFGKARRHDESVINNHPSVTAAEVTFDFDYESDRFRVQRTNPRGKTSLVEFFQLSRLEGKEDRWKTLSERTLRETNKKIEATLHMDFETFTNASFFLQGKADQFATASPGDRKKILSNILGLSIWETYRDAAALQKREHEKEIKELDGRLSEIQSELDDGPQRKIRLKELQGQLETLTRQREAYAKNLETVRRLQFALEEQRKMVNNLQGQLEGATRNHDRTLETLEERRAEKAGYDEKLAEAESIERAYQQWQSTRQALETMEAVAKEYRQHEALRQEPLRVIQVEQARLMQEKQSLEEQKSLLAEQCSSKEGLQAQLTIFQEKIQNAQEKLAQRETLEEEIRQLQADQAEAKAENPRLCKEGLELGKRIDQLGGTDAAECPLCRKPLSPEEREDLVRQLTREREDMRARYAANRELLNTFESDQQKMGSKLADLKGVEGELREFTRQVDQIQHKLTTIQSEEDAWQAQGAPRLNALTTILAEETFAKEARARLAAIETELEALGYDMDAHEQLRKGEQAGQTANADLLALEQARAALAPLEREIKGLEVQVEEQAGIVTDLARAHKDAVAALSAEEANAPDLTQAEADLHDTREQENRLRMQVGGAQQEVDILDTLTRRKAALLEEREGLTQRVADLKLLERAFGKDGIPAMLIEQALPEIEENTNELLSSLTNGRMSFRFITQREYQDTKREDLMETLEMVISDSAGVRDYEMFSGGEAFRINFSIRLALSKVLASRAGARLQTLVIDEGFGSQDAQGRQRLVEAINLVQHDFEKILVITHLEELKEIFPNRVEVEKTPQGSQLRVI